MPPDTTAGIFWLKNRKPDQWRDAWQLEHKLGKYLISDKPMSKQEWIAAHAVDVTPPDDDENVTPAIPEGINKTKKSLCRSDFLHSST